MMKRSIIGIATLPLLLFSAPQETAFPSSINQFSLLAEEDPLTPLDEEISFLTEEFETELSLQEHPKEISLSSSEEKQQAQETPLVSMEERLEFPVASEEVIQVVQKQEPQEANTLVVEQVSAIGEPSHLTPDAISIDLMQAFRGSPTIYSILFCLSVCALGIFLYTLGSIQLSTHLAPSLVRQIQHQLMNNQFQEALNLCRTRKTLFPQMLQIAIQSRAHGLPTIVESMKLEGKRSTVFFWQKIGLLNDIAIIAPMLGLLGTVLGMFYAFYDVNRSIESISTLFDGLGISVGTTVAGIIVAIVALILHSIAKYRLVRALAKVENEA